MSDTDPYAPYPLTGDQEPIADPTPQPPRSHRQLWQVVKLLPDDWAPYGRRKRDGINGAAWGEDCSMGCRWFAELRELPMDWGVCCNPRSHRAGLLTFEHQAGPCFESYQTETGEPWPVGMRVYVHGDDELVLVDHGGVILGYDTEQDRYRIQLDQEPLVSGDYDGQRLVWIDEGSFVPWDARPSTTDNSVMLAIRGNWADL